MKSVTRTLIATAAGLAIVAVYAATTVRAIGPTAMIFYGEPLKKQVLISGRDIDLFGDLTQPVHGLTTSGRTFITVALFWGTPSNPGGNGVPVAQLTPEMAQQHGRFYPATETQPALIIMTTPMKQMAQPPPNASQGVTPYVWGGQVAPDALAMLKRLGIPTGSQK